MLASIWACRCEPCVLLDGDSGLPSMMVSRKSKMAIRFDITWGCQAILPSLFPEMVNPGRGGS